jgi:transcriptional regulator GlxA family with amidase domain
MAIPANMESDFMIQHSIAVLVFDGVIVPDLSPPLGVFGRTEGYDIRLCGPEKTIQTQYMGLSVPHDLSALTEADTVFVPGIEDIERVIPPAVLNALKLAHARGARIASICTGAFVLAAAGLLDGLTATTHWRVAGALARRCPDAVVEENMLFVDNGQVLCSAGAAAGLDLCLHMLRADKGAAVAAQVARLAVVQLAREGGQAQFIDYDFSEPTETLDPLLDWVRENLDQPLTVADLAHRAAKSVRTLNRRFHQQTGTTPLQWVQRERVRRAQYLLEVTPLSVEEITTRTGFGTAANLRDRFFRVVGVTPSVYRKTFAGRHTGLSLEVQAEV